MPYDHLMDGTTSRNLTLLYASSLTVMSGATIAPSLPLIESVFVGTPHLDLLVPLVLTMPSLLIAVGSWVLGFAVDRWGRRPFLVGVGPRCTRSRARRDSTSAA